MLTKLLGFGTAVLAFCQMFGQMTPHGPAFEVASVKRAVQPGGRGAASSVVDPGRIYYASTTLRYLLIQAYGVKGSQISGPSWLDTEQYDVAAKVPEGAPETQIPAMLQNLLAERFRMTVRRETQVQPAYVLLVDKNGPRLRSSENAGEPKYGARIRGDVSMRGEGKPTGGESIVGYRSLAELCAPAWQAGAHFLIEAARGSPGGSASC